MVDTATIITSVSRGNVTKVNAEEGSKERAVPSTKTVIEAWLVSGIWCGLMKRHVRSTGCQEITVIKTSTVRWITCADIKITRSLIKVSRGVSSSIVGLMANTLDGMERTSTEWKI